MATVRPLSPQYQHTLDSAISLAKELASKNMADSGDSSPKTPNSPDKRRFNFKLKHLSKSFCEASGNFKDIEDCISNEAKQAYKSLVEKGPFNSFAGRKHNYHHQTIGPAHASYHHQLVSQYANFDLNTKPCSLAASSGHSSSKTKHHFSSSTLSVKKSFF